ncbi:MAG: LPXTG cell wall anchor domain-containing protein [Microbacteriaceae bacterium]|nr:MAG: LPXTG cell wall anchor domain-containing protein [Microbacteriaceae bacterium]
MRRRRRHRHQQLGNDRNHEQHNNRVRRHGWCRRTGYTFSGWFTDPTGGAPWAFSDPVTVDTVLYAHWAAVVTPTAATVVTGLAKTGSDLVPGLLSGLALLLAGAGALWLQRRKHLGSDRV